MGESLYKNSSSDDSRDIFNNIIDGVCILDSKGNIKDVNLATSTITGYSREELVNMNVQDLMHPDEIENSRVYFQKLQEQGSYEDFSVRQIGKNGEIKHLEISSKAFYNEKGELIGSKDIIRDVTEKKQIESELINSEQKFRTVVTNSEAIIFILDNDGVFTLSEGKGLKALGLEPGEVVGVSVYDLYKDYKDIISAVKLALKGESSKLIVQVENLYFDTFYSPYLSSQGEIQGVIGLSVDITDRIQKEKELEVARRKAEESDQLKSAFLANISHEIRTPMNAIIGFSSLMLERELSQLDRKNYLEIIQSKGNELLRMLTDLIDLSKIEAGMVSLNKKPFNLNRLLMEFVSMAKQELSIRNNLGVEIRHSIPAEEVIVNNDEFKIRQILNNLIQNSVKFTRKGTIEIRLIKEQKQVIILVKDTGIGIEESQQEIIFERFRQADDSFTRSIGGTGLGLYISRTLITQMGGKIWVESGRGKGSGFYFSIPLA